MAVTQGKSTFGMTLKYYEPGSTAKYTKNIDYINMKVGEEGSGYGIDAVYDFLMAVNTSICGGASPSISSSEEFPIEEEE